MNDDVPLDPVGVAIDGGHHERALRLGTVVVFGSRSAAQGQHYKGEGQMELRIRATPDLLGSPQLLVEPFEDPELTVQSEVRKIHRKSAFDLPPEVVVVLLIKGAITATGGYALQHVCSVIASGVRRLRQTPSSSSAAIAVEIRADDGAVVEYRLPGDSRDTVAFDGIPADLQTVVAPDRRLWVNGAWISQHDL